MMAQVRRLRSRERVPVAEYRNFRSSSMTLDAPILRIVGSLSQRWGESWASERALRRLICQDTAHMPGVDSVRQALDRLMKLGLIVQIWLVPGGVMPDGSICTHGTRIVRLVVGRRVVRARRARPLAERMRRRTVRTPKEASAEIAALVATAPLPPRQSAERSYADGVWAEKRASDLVRLAELAEQWAREDAAAKRPK